MKKLLSFLVAAMMVLSILPVGAVSLAEKEKTGSAEAVPEMAVETAASPSNAEKSPAAVPAALGNVVFDFEDTPDSDGFHFWDADGDGEGWYYDFDMGSVYGCHDGNGAMSSVSWDQYDGARDPDNWFITPPLRITGNSMLNFWIRSGDDHYTGDKVKVLASFDGGESWEHVMTAEAEEDWEEVGTDISDWSGSWVKLAFRHCESENISGVNVDDITITDAELASTAIGSVNCTGFSVPQFEQNATDILPKAPNTAAYEITEAKWIANYSGSDHIMSDTDQFDRTDAAYRLRIEYTPVSYYYTFSSSCSVRINGSSQYVGTVTRAARSITVETVSFTVSPGTAIDEVSISGLTVPEVGATAAEFLSRSVPSDAHYHIETIIGRDETTETELTDSTVFVWGHSYSIYVYIEADSGWYFADDCTYLFNYVSADIDHELTGRDSYISALVASEPMQAKYAISYIDAVIASFPPRAGQQAVSGTQHCIVSDSRYAVIDFDWFDAETGAPFTGTFVLGHEYYCYYQVFANDDFFFKEDCEPAINHNGSFIDNGAHVEADYRSAQVYSVHVAAVDDDHIISDVNVDGFLPPMPGHYVDEFYSGCEVPSNAHYYIGAITAADITDPQNEIGLSFGTEYELGNKYRFIFTLQTEPGYYFSPDCSFYLNNNPLYVDAAACDASDPLAAVLCTVDIDTKIPITYVSLEDLSIPPMIGDDAEDCLDFSIGNSAHCRIVHRTWIDDDGEYFTGAFAEGGEYQCACVLVADDGYCFDPECFVLINGDQYYLDAAAVQPSLNDMQVFTVLMEAADDSAFIHSIELENLTYPVVGASVLDFMTTITAPDYAHYSVVSIQSGEPGVCLFSGDEVFEAGHRYSLSAAVQPERGWYIADDCEFYIDGTSLLVSQEYSYVSSRCTAWVATVDLEPRIAITEVHINGFVPAIVGEPSGSMMDVRVPSGAVYHLTDVRWFAHDPDTYEWEHFTGVFGTEDLYSMGFALACDDGYIFTRDTVVYINDDEVTFSLQGSGTALHTSTEPTAARLPLMEIDILGMRAPRAGESVFELLYELELPEGALYDFSGTAVYDITTGTRLTRDSVFEEGHEYCFQIMLRASGDNVFSTYADLLINGSADLVDISQSGIMGDRTRAIIVTNNMLCEASAVTLLGDIDLDGEVTAADALLAMRHALNITTVEGQGYSNGDMDGDGQLTANDAILIMRAVIGT